MSKSRNSLHTLSQLIYILTPFLKTLLSNIKTKSDVKWPVNEFGSALLLWRQITEHHTSRLRTQLEIFQTQVKLHTSGENTLKMVLYFHFCLIKTNNSSRWCTGQDLILSQNGGKKVIFRLICLFGNL